MTKRKKVTISKVIILAITALLVVLFDFSINKFVFNKKDKNIIDSVCYNTKGNVNDYKVYLFPNDYFQDDYLEKDKTYIGSLIDKVKINYHYIASFSEEVSGEYEYYIKGTIVADKLKDDGKPYWEESYELTKPKKIKFENKKSYLIMEDFEIDYQKYNNRLVNFRKDFGLSFNGMFKVDLVIINNAGTEKIVNIFDDNKKQDIVSLKIPLTQQTIEISFDSSNTDKSDCKTNIIKVENKNKLYFISFNVFLGIILFYLFYRIGRGILYIKSLTSEYTKELKKILSTYDSILVGIKKLPNMDDMKIIQVNDFSELIDAHSEVRMPINFIEEKNHFSIFVLISDQIAWIYVLMNENFRKRKINNKYIKQTK